jgi:hypothetical protein
MPALERLCHFVGFNANQFTKEENILLEVELYSRITHQIWKNYKAQYKDYFRIVELNVEKENLIMEMHIIRCLINDILKSETYTLSGIAYYTETPEEIIQDLMIGYKIGPVLVFTRKLIELHKLVKPELYQDIIHKLRADEPKDEIDEEE